MGDSRKHQRFNCTGLAELNAVEGGKRGWGHLADISEGGVYLSTTHPWACGVQVNFVLQMNDVEIHGKGEVVTSHVGVGMGIKITDLQGANRFIFRTLLKELQAAQPQVREPD